jgi:hypothetical protein
MSTGHEERAAGSPEGSRDQDETKSGLQFGVATQFEQVMNAWHLVYVAYRRLGLVDANEFEIHTSRQAASPQAAVITGDIRGTTAATLTAVRDGELGLPLDGVYAEEIGDLRARGRGLTEVGLFADRREDMGRSLSALLGLMRFSFHYAALDPMPTVVIGVHPHHAGFYERLIGFETIGETRTYASVNDRLVTLLKLDIEERSNAPPVPRGLAFFLRNPVAPREFDNRLPFSAEILHSPPLSEYLAYKLGGRPDPRSP